MCYDPSTIHDKGLSLLEPTSVLCSNDGDDKMDAFDIGIMTAAVAVVLAAFGHTHRRISQVRQEVIDIADRNKRDVNTVADLVRAEFTMRTGEMKSTSEQIRRETREDLKDIQASSERFRDEIREKLADMETRILGAIHAPARTGAR